MPPEGVVVSIGNAGGLVVDASGVGAGTKKGGGAVSIIDFIDELKGTTLSDGIGMLCVATATVDTYEFHRITVKNEDVIQLSDDINDFQERYRVGTTNPTEDLDAGDLFYNTATGKMLVYNEISGEWEEVQSIGQYYTVPASELEPFSTGTSSEATISNAPTQPEQLLLSINGVIQQPNAGTSTPAEGFALDGAVIKLAETPAAGSEVFAVIIGSTVNIGVPSANTVDTLQLVDSGVTLPKLQNVATANRLLGSYSADSPVAEVQVATGMIQNEAVTYAKLQHTANDNRLLGATTAGAVGEVQVQTAMVANNAITNSKLGLNSVTANEILDEQVTEPKLGTESAGSTGEYLQKTATGMDWAPLVVPASVPAGSVHMFATATVPADYLVADGSDVSRTTYADLFIAIGTTYGAGDGSTTFTLPDLRNYFIRGADPNGGRAVGDVEADATAVNGLSLNDPGHAHGQGLRSSGGSIGGGTSNGAGGNYSSTSSANTNITFSSSDTETRPVNVALLYAIKA